MNESILLEKLGMQFPTQETDISSYMGYGSIINVKRDDLIHPIISGNKWRKIRLHLHQARFKKCDTLLTVGGAFSNHLIAVAAAAHHLNMNSVGVIRGEEADFDNPTLREVRELGMKCIPITREEYKDRHSEFFRKNWGSKYPLSYWIPEGGGGYLGIQGCIDIAKEIGEETEIIALSAGTGTTATGILLGTQPHQKVWVFPALKGDFMKDEIKQLLFQSLQNSNVVDEYLSRLVVYHQYAGKGFAKIDSELISFVRDFYHKTEVPLDLIYTGKAMIGLKDVLDQQLIEKPQKITFLHTGGLQGNKGFEEKLGIKLY